jgi:hypothetical protein
MKFGKSSDETEGWNTYCNGRKVFVKGIHVTSICSPVLHSRVISKTQISHSVKMNTVSSNHQIGCVTRPIGKVYRPTFPILVCQTENQYPVFLTYESFDFCSQSDYRRRSLAVFSHCHPPQFRVIVRSIEIKKFLN